jgi:stearoyl-CoA desaturase (delta-9 desaturase)
MKKISFSLRETLPTIICFLLFFGGIAYVASINIWIAIFFVIHWYGSLFVQTFFLHRYASHKLFSMTSRQEKIWFIITWIFQGSSWLNQVLYALLHRAHHAFSDTAKDPHSPHYHHPILPLMWQTKKTYSGAETNPDYQRFSEGIPRWQKFEKFADHRVTRIMWVIFYTLIYLTLLPNLTNGFVGEHILLLLLPIHYLMGPIHGMIVNWFGHQYGYQNFDNHDKSTNTFIVDLVMLGECYQNNHHHDPSNVNFAQKKFEWDPVYWICRIFDRVGIISLKR